MKQHNLKSERNVKSEKHRRETNSNMEDEKLNKNAIRKYSKKKETQKLMI